MKGPLHYSEMIPLIPSGQCEVIEYLDEGGQGYIYITNKNRALKWYKENINSDMKTNIQELVQHHSPYPNITWPIAITQDYKNSFGYIMPRIPRDYVSLNYYLYDDKYYLNVEEMLQIAYAIVDTFDAIHRNGYIYQDINPNGIMINKKNQSVIICDVDNCNQKGQSYVMGTKMYMAPEIMLGDKPSLYSDYYSLSVILFRLFYINHPLEGAKTWAQPLNDTLELEYFGKHPVFVCDPNDHSNGFYKDYTEALKQRWHRFPSILEDAFIRAFTDGLMNPKHRLNEKNWKNIIKECYRCLVKKNIDGHIKQGFVSNDKEYLKIDIIHQKILLSDYKKIYGYIFDSQEIFSTILFECQEYNHIIIKNKELYINHKLMHMKEEYILKAHDIIEYHGKKGIIFD